MKNLNEYVIEKLRISSKNDFSKYNIDNDIPIDFDYDYDHNAKLLNDVFPKNDLNDIIVFANQLEKKPTKISNKFNGSFWADFIILYYDNREHTRITISAQSEDKYNIDILYDDKKLYHKYGLDSLSDALVEIEKGIDKEHFFKKL